MASVPTADNELGFGMLELGWVLEAAGRVLAPVPLLSTAVGARALAAAGHTTPLAPIAKGSALVALALEDESDDALQPSVTAEPVAAGWRLQGTKTAVAYGLQAAWLLLSATTPEGPALFVVSRETAGLKLSAQRSTHGEPWALVTLEGVELPPDAKLGGASALARLLDETRAAMAAHQVGVASAALQQTAAYVSQRVQFGRPLGSMQAVQQRVADAFIDVEAMRSTALRALWALDQAPHDGTTAEVAAAKYWAALGGHRVTHAAQHLHGGMGADVEYPIHRYFLQAKPNGLLLGGAQSMLALIGAEIAAGRTRPLSGVET
jgi:alkylation response protein AidB-like acyl-CoA dehydrogenase